MRVRARIIFAAVAVVLAVAGGLFLFHISMPRIVGRAIAPDGTEMCIVQQCNWSTEMFTTSFVYRRPGGDWRWFYFDHQDGYWGSSTVSLDSDREAAVFYQGDAPAVTFAWRTDTYTLHRWSRTITGAQRQLPNGWNPNLPVYGL